MLKSCFLSASSTIKILPATYAFNRFCVEVDYKYTILIISKYIYKEHAVKEAFIQKNEFFSLQFKEYTFLLSMNQTFVKLFGEDFDIIVHSLVDYYE